MRANPVTSADFDENYQPINRDYPASAPSQYTVRAGDTLKSIAQSMWGDSSLWYMIADANGLSGSDTLTAGRVLTIPNKVANIHNNATTFRPYDVGAAIGDTSPTLPEPPPPDQGGGCGGIGLVILIIVIVVATIFTAGAAAVAFGALGTTTLATASAATIFTAGTTALAGGFAAGVSIAAAAIGGAVGSIVGQGLSIAAGYQDKFSWRQVGISALGSGLSAGLGSAFNGAQGGLAVKAGLQAGSNTAAAFNAGVNSIATQGVLVAAGLQEKFSWKSVAASAVSAAVSNQISTSLQGAPIRDGAGKLTTGADGQILRTNTAFANYNAGAARVTSDFISGITGAYIRHGITDSQINFRDAAAESVGNAIGNEIVGGLIRKEETSKALAFDYSLAEGEAKVPGLRSSNRNGYELGRLSALDNSRSASFLERSLADAGRTTQIDIEELPIETVIGKRINPLTDLLTNYKPDFLGTARNWWNAYRSGENSLGDTIRGLWDNLDFDYKIEFRAANLAGAAGNGIVAGAAGFAAFGSAPSGIGLLGFGTIAGVQGDAAIAKLQSVWEGERVSTGLELGLESLGVSERYAERAAVGAEFLTGIPAVATSLPRLGGTGVTDSTEQFISDVHGALRQNLNAGELANFQTLDPTARIGLTGSTATGRVGNPNKATFGQRIDTTKFDLDLFVQSDLLLEHFGTKLQAAPILRQSLVDDFPDLFVGLKPGKEGLSIKFRPHGEPPKGSIVFE